MSPELAIIFFSFISLIIGAVLWQKGNYLLAHGKKAKAIVFRNEQDTSRSGGGMYYPVIRFTTDKEEWITTKLDVGFSPPKAEGAEMKIVYDPDEPTNLQIDSPLMLEILPRLLTAIGLAGLVVGLLAYVELTQLFN